MKKQIYSVRLAVILLLVSSWMCTGTEKVFHFDFNRSDFNGVLKDISGKIECRSPDKLFVREHGGLRLAEGVRLFVPGTQLPELAECFSINIWVNNARRARSYPICSMGEWPSQMRFMLGIHHLFPQMIYNNTQGCGTAGSSHYVHYKRPEAIVGKAPSELLPGRWYMLTAIFDRGNVLIYQNGKLTINASSAAPSRLFGKNSALWLGAERKSGDQVNHNSGNMLVNDWRLYRSVLRPEEIQQIYEAEKEKYTQIVLTDTWNEFPDCPDYLEQQIPGYDPLFRKKLAMTAEYEKNPPPIPNFPSALHSELRTTGGQTRMFINDQEYYPMMFPSYHGNPSIREKSTTQFEQIRDFAAAGFPLLGAGIHTSRDLLSTWTGDGKYDFSVFDELMQKAIAAAPTGLIQLVLYPWPVGWFQRDYKTHLELAYPGRNPKNPLQVFYSAPYGSEVWLRVSSEYLGEVVRYLEKQPYANRIYDYKLFCGGGGEWYWPGCFIDSASGYSAATRDTFRKFLREKYKDDATIQKAWGNPDIQLDTVTVPLPAERFATECFNFRDPVKGRASMDFREYMAYRTLLNLTENTKAIKEATSGKKTLTLYYGYGIFFSSANDPTQQTSGILGLQKVLRLPYVDHIATPISYRNRRGGMPGPNYCPFNGSARLHNKLIWQENDIRTHLYPKNEFGKTSDLTESLTVIRRGFGQALTSGMGVWYYAMIPYAFHEKSIMETMRDLQLKSREIMKRDRSSVAEIALIFDEKSMLDVAFRKDNFIKSHIYETYLKLFHTGAPFDAYLAEDLVDPQMPDYKLYLFVNLYSPSEAVRKAVATKIRKGGVAVFSYAPGLIKDGTFDDRAMKELTGISLRHTMKEASLKLEITNPKHPLTEKLGAMPTYLVGPIVEVNDPAAAILGKAGKFNALGLRDFGSWKSVYTLMPPSLEMLSGFCDLAGVHCYAAPGDVLGANRSFIMLHTVENGDKTISLQRPATVTELFSGAILGKKVMRFTDREVPAQATRIYELKHEE